MCWRSRAPRVRGSTRCWIGCFRVRGRCWLAADAPLVTRARHRDALAESVDALDRFRGAGGAELVVLAEELRIAAHALGRITGRVGTEEILDRIFATFCIGK